MNSDVPACKVRAFIYEWQQNVWIGVTTKYLVEDILTQIFLTF